ncbi:MAG: serine hydrolase [Polyangiaceae bacterium]
MLRWFNVARWTLVLLSIPLGIGCVQASVRSVDSAATATSSSSTGGMDESPLFDGDERPSSLEPFLDGASALRMQILLAIPDNSGGLVRRSYRADAEYFYPASAVKLAAAVAALEKLEALRATNKCPSVGVETPLRIAVDGGRVEELDATNIASGRITVGHEIRKALLVSNNEAFNRLFSFVGYDDLESGLRAHGFESTSLRHFVGWGVGDARSSPKMQLFPAHCAAIDLPARTATSTPPPTNVKGVLVGQAHYDEKGRLKNEPMSFATKNRASLRDLQDLLISVVRPELIPQRTLQLSTADREFLIGALGTLPSESKNPVFNRAAQPDAMHRPLWMAVRRLLPKHEINSYGKGGQAYGFIVQNAYLVDETTGRGVFVAATIHVNSNGTLNDDQYEYSEIGKPFIDGLAEFVAKKYLM